MITVLHWGGNGRVRYAQMITILHGGSLRTPKSDYVICARPLTESVHENEIQRIFHFSLSRANVRLVLVFILLITMTLLTCSL